jgi:hypothetical protein
MAAQGEITTSNISFFYWWSAYQLPMPGSGAIGLCTGAA